MITLGATQRWILEKETISCAISIAMNCFFFSLMHIQCYSRTEKEEK